MLMDAIVTRGKELSLIAPGVFEASGINWLDNMHTPESARNIALVYADAVLAELQRPASR